MRRPIWFKAKKYGWGWYPSTWQGWLILLFFVFLMVADFRSLDVVSHSASDTLRPWIIHIFILTLILIWICWLTGEKPRWRWEGK